MNDKQKLVVFKSALAEKGFKSNITSLEDKSFKIFTIESFWKPELIYGKVKNVNGVLTYFMFGAPKTNYEIVNLIQDVLELNISDIEFDLDTPMKPCD